MGEFSRISVRTKSYTRQEQTLIKILFEANKKQKESLTLGSVLVGSASGDAHDVILPCLPRLGVAQQCPRRYSGGMALPVWKKSRGLESAPTVLVEHWLQNCY